MSKISEKKGRGMPKQPFNFIDVGTGFIINGVYHPSIINNNNTKNKNNKSK